MKAVEDWNDMSKSIDYSNDFDVSYTVQAYSLYQLFIIDTYIHYYILYSTIN